MNQTYIASFIQSLSKAIYFSKKMKIDINKAMEIISKGAEQSWQMENRTKTMINKKFNFGFALDWMKKDLSFCLKEAKKNDIPLPITKLMNSYYKMLQEDGKGRWDTSNLIENLYKSRL